MEGEGPIGLGEETIAAVPLDDVDAWLESLKQGNLLPPHVLQFVCRRLQYTLSQESNVQPLSAPVAIIGDVHGQFYDVLEIFRIGGPVPHTNYLFLGDYVDRGAFSVETISYLACLKLRFHGRITLIRGNHESRQTTMTYGFYQECMQKYGRADVWQWFMEMFDYLPLAATIDNRVFATHGGISPSLHSLDQIRVLDRVQEIPHSGPICDLMWADPDTEKEGFHESWRGAGYTFGKEELEQFNHLNGLSYFVRAHQLCQEGYQELWDCFATVWSAPNYCYRFGNKASICEFADSSQKPFFNVFEACPDNERKPRDAPVVKATWFDEYAASEEDLDL